MTERADVDPPIQSRFSTGSVQNPIQCMTPKQSLSICTRAARYLFVRDHEGTSADPDKVVYAQCAQHYRSDFGRMLAPHPWEYSRVYDSSANMNVGGR